MVPLLPAAKDALSARYTHEMLVNAKTTELALMIFGTTGEWLFFFQEESSLASFFFSLFVFAHVVDPSFFSFDLFQPPFQKKNAESSNLLNDEEPQNFRHIVAPKGIDAEGAGRPLLEPVSPAAVLLPLEELIARALADDANKRRCRKASSSSFSSSSSPPPRADTLDVVLVAHSILLSALGGHEAASDSPCSKTITVVVAGEEEVENEKGGNDDDDDDDDGGLAGQAALLLQQIGCKLRVLLVDPSPALRARGGVLAAAKKEEEEGERMKPDDDGDGGIDDDATSDDDDDELPPLPRQLRLPAALEALVDALPRGQGLVRIQRVAGAVGLSAAIMEAPPPATTFWRGDLELAAAASGPPTAQQQPPLSPAAGGGAPVIVAPPPSSPPPSESRIPVKVSRCVTAPETPKWVRMSKPAAQGGVPLKQETEYRRRSPAERGGGIGEGGDGGGGGGEGQDPRAAKMARVDAAAARLAPVFERFDDGPDDDGAGDGGDVDAAAAADKNVDFFDGADKNNANRASTRSLSPEAVAKEEQTSCYRYGQEIVPLSAALREQACRLPGGGAGAGSARSMLLLGFATPPPLHAIAEGAWALTAGGAPSGAGAARKRSKAAASGGDAGGGDDPGGGSGGSKAAEALSALARAAHRNGKVMVVRWVSRAGGGPRLYAGFPVLGEEIGEGESGGGGGGGGGKEAAAAAEEKKPNLDEKHAGLHSPTPHLHHHHRRPRLSSPDCFVLVALPFAEDVRRVRFPALDADERRLPDRGQVAAARELVRAWDLRGSGLFARAAVDGAEGRRIKVRGGGKGKGEENEEEENNSIVFGGAHPNPSRLRQLACAAGKAVALIRAGEGGGGGGGGGDGNGAAAARYVVPEVGRGPATGLLEPPAWPAGSRADAAARRLAAAFAGGL